MYPGHSDTVLVALARTAGTPTAVITGKLINVPPPAMALTTPAASAAPAHARWARPETSLIASPDVARSGEVHRCRDRGGLAPQRRQRGRRLAPWRQVGEQSCGGLGDRQDGPVERCLRRRRRRGDPAHLAHVLPGCGLDLLRRGDGLQPAQGGDVAAHAGNPTGRWP